MVRFCYRRSGNLDVTGMNHWTMICKVRLIIGLAELPELNNLQIPRSLQFKEDTELSAIHTFVDASTEAYGTVLYVRHVMKSGEIVIRFIAAKARVASSFKIHKHTSFRVVRSSVRVKGIRGSYRCLTCEYDILV